MKAQTKEEERADRIRLEMLECRHWRGSVHHDDCKAGVNYRQHVGGPDLGWALRLPCREIGLSKDVAKVPCEKRDCWTAEEAAANVDAMEVAIENHMRAHRVAHDDAKARGLKRGHGGAGMVRCPCCETGDISYTVASYNGHMHAACSTDGCVRWME